MPPWAGSTTGWASCPEGPGLLCPPEGGTERPSGPERLSAAGVRSGPSSVTAGAQGDFYAAGISYFTIFALFPLLAVAAVVGSVLASRPDVLAEIDGWVKAAASRGLRRPGQQPDGLGHRLAHLGRRDRLATALWAGLGWMSNLRRAHRGGDSQRRQTDSSRPRSPIWGRWCRCSWPPCSLSASLRPPIRRSNSPAHCGVSLALSVLVAWVMFTAMIAKLPRRPVPMRAAARAGLLAAIGFEGVQTGRFAVPAGGAARPGRGHLRPGPGSAGVRLYDRSAGAVLDGLGCYRRDAGYRTEACYRAEASYRAEAR